MKRIFDILTIILAMIMAASALTPADVVREAKEPKKPAINTQGVNASVFDTGPFAKDKTRTTPLADATGKKFFGIACG